MLRNQIGRVIFGVILIVLGLGIRVLDQHNATVVKYVCGTAQSGAACDIVQLGLVTLGLGAVWTILILIGIFYAVIYDWLLGTVTSLVDDVVEKFIDIKAIALRQIGGNRLPVTELREIFCHCMASILGTFEQGGTEFAEFVFDGISSRKCPSWRRGHNTSITIEAIESDNRLSDRYFRFTETNTYTVVSPTTGKVYPFKSNVGIEASTVELSNIIDNFKYSLAYDGGEIKFDSVRDRWKVAEVTSPAGQSEGSFHLRFPGSQLDLAIQHDIPLSSRETSITTDEVSFLLKTDKSYVKVLNEPSKGFTFRFRVPPGHEIVACSASVDGFEWHPGQTPGKALSVQERSVNLNVARWALPGIATFVVWRQKVV